MNLDQFTAYSMMFKHELEKAETKHPKFCDALFDPDINWAKQEIFIKNYLNKVTDKYYANDIFDEEFAEAMNAYQQGDKAHAMQELAQCGAVILRMMELVRNEVNNDAL